METKHKPATPLPWDKRTNVSGNPDLVARMQDEKYRLHASNSYPKLVEALRQIAKPALGGKQQQYAAQEILRELGEPV